MDAKKAAREDRQHNQQINFTPASHFLQAIDPAGGFTFQTFDDNPRKDHYLAKVFHGTFSEHRNELARLNKAGAGIFVTVNKTDGRGRKKENVTVVRAVFLDLDGAPLPDEWPIEPHLIVESSPGRYHAYWLVEGNFPLTQFEGVQKAIAAKFHGDPAVCDLPRVMRIPGFLHQKHTPFLSRIIRDHSLEPRYSPEQILEFFPSPESTRGNTTQTDDPILKALEDKGMLIRADRAEKGKFLITCPWADTHTTGDPEAAYWQAHTGGHAGAGFRCLHGHCVDKTIRELKSFLGYEPEDTWPDPEALPNRLSPVDSFSYDLLPEAFRSWIKDISERMQCPPDFPAIGAIVSLSAVVGRKIGIRPKRHDDWTVIPNLWGAVIGRPGIMKTPALDQAKLPLDRLSAEAIDDYSQEEKTWSTRSLVLKTKREILTTNLKAALKAGNETSGIEAEIASLQNEFPAPICKRYFVNDATVEKLEEILKENPNGVLVFRDELTGWLKSLEREGRENDRAFYLESWNGSGSYTCDRIGRGTVHIPNVCLSILGGIQPGPLSEYVREASKNGSGADGLLQRFQLIAWPDDPKDWQNVDRWPDTVSKNRAYEVFKQLAALDPCTIGAERNEDGSPFLHFSEEAQEVFDAWREILEREKLRSGDADMIESALAKYRSLIPSLALLFHLADGNGGPVGTDSLFRAIDWGDYLESHLRRVYGGAIDPDSATAHALMEKIHERKIVDGTTLRDIHRKHWTGITFETLSGGLSVLTDFNILRTELVPASEKGGRSSVIIKINPKLRGTK